MKKRITWIDICKGLGMWFVIFNHIPLSYGQDRMMQVIASFHMPLFFFLSGYCLRNMKDRADCPKTQNSLSEHTTCCVQKEAESPHVVSQGTGMRVFGQPVWGGVFQLVENIVRRSVSLLVPYYIWAFIFSSGVTGKNILYIVYGANLTLAAAGSNSVLWFLPCMLASTVLCMIVLYTVGKSRRLEKRCNVAMIISCIIFFALGLCVSSIEWSYPYPFSINVALYGAGFMMFGFLVKESGIAERVACKNCWFKLIVMVVSFVATVALTFCNREALANSYGRVVMALSLLGNPFLFIASGICGSIFITALSMLIDELSSANIMKRFLILAGKNTIVILAVHKSLMKCVTWIAGFIPDIRWLGMTYLFVSCTAILIVSLVFAIFVRLVAHDLTAGQITNQIIDIRSFYILNKERGKNDG